MNPFEASERHRYIIESGGIPASSTDEQEMEMWVNSINVDLDIPIYRYMKWEYLQKFYFSTRYEWILAHPCLWQLAQQQDRTPINCWKSHLNDHPQYLAPILDI